LRSLTDLHIPLLAQWILGYGFLSTVYTVFTIEPLTPGGGMAPRVGFATLADNRLAEVLFNGSFAGGESTQADAGAGVGSQTGARGASSTPGSAAVAEAAAGRSLRLAVGAAATLVGVALF
jgi:hypothetical protein